jgi:Family of unknown function (DUF6461)
VSPVEDRAVAGYSWVEEFEAYCFTAVIGIDADEAIRRLGGDPASPPSLRTFQECFWPADGPQWAQVGCVDGGLIVAEHNGWQAEENVERLSRGARLACFFRNIQAVMHFVYAVDGAVLAEFDPLLERRPVSGADPLLIVPALEGLPFGLFSAEMSSLTLVERLTGVRIERSWLDTPQRAVALPPLGPG